LSQLYHIWVQLRQKSPNFYELIVENINYLLLIKI